MPLATTRGRDFALKALAERRAENNSRTPFENSRLMAGSPVYLDCIACGGLIEHPENYLVRVELCSECGALLALGWLNE